jgi:hypothetical protein
MHAEPQKSSSEAISPSGKSSAQPTEKTWEDRPGWASCFPPRNAKIEHPADFTGVTVLAGQKYWVNVYKKFDRNGARYVSVHVKPWEAR